MKLSARQREILEALADEDSEADLVEAGPEVWFGNERTNHGTLKFFLQRCLISEEQYSGHDCRRYRINEWGRRVLSDPDFEPLDQLSALIMKTEAAGRK